MDRRSFLGMSAGGLVGACLPSMPFGPSLDDLVNRAVGLDEAARSSAILECGRAVDAGEALPRERLKDALDLHIQAVALYEEARRRYPEDVLLLELLADAQMEMGRIEILMGSDATDRIASGLASAAEWVRLAPTDPVATGALAYHRTQAERQLAISSEPMPALLPPETLTRVFRQVA